jgi:hypothetical protein
VNGKSGHLMNRLGFLLTEESTRKLLEVSEFMNKDPYTIIMDTINLMYRVQREAQDG